MSDLLNIPEQARKVINGSSSRKNRSKIGQFLTPAPIAQFMASLFSKEIDFARILDPGAGAGVLFAAFFHELSQCKKSLNMFEVTAFENDSQVHSQLEKTIALCCDRSKQLGIEFKGTIHNGDFISSALNQVEYSLFNSQQSNFTHAILNPPYKKINSKSDTRKQLNAAGMEISNLYAAFLWLSAKLLQPSGELVSITPRSFCNGPYFKRFRKDFLKTMSIRHIHLFESRKKAFADDSVLQENIIIYAVKNEPQPEYVNISVSDGLEFNNITTRKVPFSRVVFPDDSDSFIHLAQDEAGDNAMARMAHFGTFLSDLGLSVSTGRVVDFRVRRYLRAQPEPGTVPLIYPCHFKNGFVKWPVKNKKKPNAILSTDETSDLLIPSGHYVLTKRFSAKEERRRIVAAIYDPSRIETDEIGFENHLNYYHTDGNGISASLAKGLALYLNSTLCDQYFRLFSGHTQVNATDLRKMRYPTRQELVRLGKHIKKQMPNQDKIDLILDKVCGEHG